MRILSLILSVIAVFTSSTMANAGVILTDLSTGASQIQNSQAIGQSFTAEDPFVLFAFSFFDVNQANNPNQPLTMRLLDGDGLTGNLLTTVSQTLPANLGTLANGVFVDFDLSSVPLVVSQSYTVLIEAPSTRWGVDNNLTTNAYLGGMMYSSGNAVPGGDMDFRVTPIAVPEPSAFGLCGLLVVVGCIRRRRR